MSFDAIELGSRIRMYRSYRDMTQKELANATGINNGTIKKYEEGSMVPGSDKVFLIAEALGVTPNDLLAATGVPR